MWRSFIESWELQNTMPNKFTIYLGRQVKEARKEKKASQDELAKAVYKRRASISDIENGKMMPDIATMVYMSNYFKKSIDYFLHPQLRYNSPDPNKLTQGELEMLQAFSRLTEAQQQVAIKQILLLTQLDE